MATDWKLVIIEYLNHGDQSKLQTSLRGLWLDIYPEHKLEVYHFLEASGLYEVFFNLFDFDLQSQEGELPWSHFLRILIELDITPPAELVKELNKNLKRQTLINENSDSLSGLHNALASKKRKDFFSFMKNRKEELLASAQIAQSERLEEQHIEYMQELKKISPSEFNVSGLISQHAKQKAEKILQKRLKQKNKPALRTASMPEDEKQLLEKISPQAQSFLESNKAKASDFAFLFRSFGEKKKAIEFVEQIDEIEKKDWHLLDYLFHGKQYISLLSHCTHLKEKYAHTPDALFPISYAEAIALWELGEKVPAIDLMAQIVAMRPGFKSASEILDHWKEESFE